MALLRPDTFAMTATLAMLTALGPLSTDMYLPSLPGIAAAFGASPAQAQLTLSAFLVGFAAGQIVHGPLSDRLGRRPVLVGGLLLFLAASLACAAAPSVESLIGARFLQALGASGPIVLARAIVRDLYEGPRAGRELARMGTIMGVVPALAPVLGGVLEALFGWRSSFLAAAGLGLLIALQAGLRLPETIRERSCVPVSFLSILRGYRSLLRVPSYRLCAALTALSYSGLFAFISGSSFVLQGIYGLSPTQFGFSFAFSVLGFITGTLVAGWLVGRIGLERTIGIGTLLLACGGLVMLGLVWLAGTATSLALTGPMALYAAGVGLVQPQTMALAMQPFPERAGAASSLLGVLQMTLAALVGIVVGHLLGASPLPLPAVIAGLGLTALLLYKESGAGAVPPPAAGGGGPGLRPEPGEFGQAAIGEPRTGSAGGARPAASRLVGPQLLPIPRGRAPSLRGGRRRRAQMRRTARARSCSAKSKARSRWVLAASAFRSP